MMKSYINKNMSQILNTKNCINHFDIVVTSVPPTVLAPQETSSATGTVIAKFESQTSMAQWKTAVSPVH